MRSPQKSNRARGRGSRKGNGGNTVNRVFESNGPEGKVRGTSQQIIEKYLTLARDAQTAGDRVNAENFLQHAEHYQRVLALALGQQQDRRDQQQSDQSDDRDDDDRGDHQQQRQVRASDDRSSDDGASDDRSSDDRSSSDRDSDDRGRGDRGGDAAVSGMQTIDAGDDDSSELIVTPEEMARSRPRKRRNGGRGQQQSEPEGEQAAETHAD